METKTFSKIMELILLNDGLYSLVSVTKEMMKDIKIMEEVILKVTEA